MIAREDKNGIVVLNWLDTRYVRVLTTKHAPEMVDIKGNSASTSRQKNKQNHSRFVNKTKPKQE